MPVKNFLPQETGNFEIHTIEWFKEKNLFSEHEKLKTFPHQILWVRSGSGVLTIGLQQYEITDKTVYCVSPGQLWGIQSKGIVDGYYISLSADYFYGAETTSTFAFLSARHEAIKTPIVVCMDDEMQQELEEILIKMRKEFIHYCSLRSEILKGLFKIFLLYLSRKFVVTEYTSAFTRDKDLVNRFLLLLGKHFTTKKMVADYASELSVTPSYLNQVVKKVSGFTASHHIQQHLVLEAKRQAIHSNRSMKEIAYGLGFDDIAHFSKFFKNNSGINFTSFKKTTFYVPQY